ncbi:MAG: DNA polymerase III subunit delta [Bacilli bacterium]|jgi:DNA polymerase-3 subunit delta
MNYLLAGDDILILKKRLSKIVSEELPEVNSFNYIELDARKTSLGDIVQTASLLPLGGSKKVVVVDFASFFTQSEPSEKDEDYAQLLNFLESDNPDSTLVFIVRSQNINEKLKAYKIIEEKGKVFLSKEISDNDWRTFVKLYFKKFNSKISEDAVSELIKRTGKESLLFTSEADKLMLYTNNITLEDVLNLVTDPMEEKQYMLTNALVKNDKPEAIRIFRDFMTQNVSPVTLVAMLANQFRLYSKVFLLDDKNYSQNEIAKTLKVHWYPVKLALDMRRQLTLEEVLDTLDQLYDIDFKIKSGQIDGAFALEMFIINY